MWLEGVQNHCFFIFLSLSKAATSLLEIQSDEFDIDLKLILQHCPVTGDIFDVRLGGLERKENMK